MTRSGLSSARGGCNTSLLRLLIIILTTLNDSLLVLSTPANGIHRLSEHKIPMPRAVATSRKFTCKEPQPRAYHLRDLVQSRKLLNPGESASQPIYIVLKRCDGHSGCCMSSDMTCTPVPTLTYFEDVEIEVEVPKETMACRGRSAKTTPAVLLASMLTTLRRGISRAACRSTVGIERQRV